ncbi:MAG TPA: hypothetical protein VM344_02965 [Vitreimonas sp.]|nr:hypothetical protein [Vitreimonas sp.]
MIRIKRRLELVLLVRIAKAFDNIVGDLRSSSVAGSGPTDG